MDKNFCQQIDQESLVEQYVAGKLRGEILQKFEQHLKDCEVHAQSVLLEKALKRGISEFARGEIKSNLKNRLKKREDVRFLILRYAAILLVAVITPLLLYYQLNVAPDKMPVAEREKNTTAEMAINRDEDKLPMPEEAPKTEARARSSGSGTEKEKRIEPIPSAGTTDKNIQENTREPEQPRQLEIAKKQGTESEGIDNMLKAVKSPPAPKTEADYPAEDEISALQDETPAMATQGYSEDKEPISLIQEINKKIKEDSLAIKSCIDNFIDVSERQKYLLSLTIEVLNDGKIGDIKIIKTTIKSSGLESCLFDIIKTWKIPDDAGEGLVDQDITY